MPSHQSTGASTERATGTRDDTWLFRYVVSMSVHVHFRFIPHESALHSRSCTHAQHCREGRACPPASHYVNDFNSTLAS